MNKGVVLLIILGIIIVTLTSILLFVPGKPKQPVPNSPPDSVSDEPEDIGTYEGIKTDVGKPGDKSLQEAAEEFIKQKIKEGISMENGPCIAEEFIPDWSIDVAHNPRQPIDDLPENQCQFYRDGITHHFIEFDTEGNIITGS